MKRCVGSWKEVCNHITRAVHELAWACAQPLCGEGKDMLKEVLVVEGKMDVAAIKKALDADCIVTGGFSLGRRALADI